VRQVNEKVRFGVFIPQGWTMDLVDVRGSIRKYDTLRRCAVEAEGSGFDSIWLYDHFHTVPRPVAEAVFECWTTMAALARDTASVTLGQMCTCVGYRPPALLAKMSSCVDVISGGRLVVGLGAGWYEHEYRAYGYEYPPLRDRLRQLEEAVQIMKLMWTQEHARFEGRHYRVDGALNDPKPVQAPHPPLWIAGSGEQVTLRLVALHADGCNIGGDLGERARKLSVLRRHCENAGRDYDSITKSTNVTVILGDKEEVDRVIEMRRRQTAGIEYWERKPYVGPAEAVAEQVSPLLALGFNHLIFGVPNAFEEGAIERVATELLPLLAGGT
jgi:F420-dependent oxidoreductase-like protein